MRVDTGISPGRNPGPADPEHRQERQLHGEFVRRAGHGLPLRALHTVPPRPPRRRLHQGGLPLLGTRRLHRAERPEDPLQRDGDLPDRLLRPLGGAGDAWHHQRDGPADQHDHTERHTQQGDVQEPHHHDRRDEGHRAGGRGDDRLGADRTQQRGVRGDPGHQITRWDPPPLRDPQPQQPSRKGAPCGQDHRLRRPLQHIRAERLDRSTQQHQDGEHDQYPGDGLTGGEPVHQRLRGQRLQQPPAAPMRAHSRPRGHGPPVRADVGVQRLDRFSGGEGGFIRRRGGCGVHEVPFLCSVTGTASAVRHQDVSMCRVSGRVRLCSWRGCARTLRLPQGGRRTGRRRPPPASERGLHELAPTRDGVTARYVGR